MKKLVSLLLVLILLLPVLACADVLTQDWKTASDEDLLAAVNKINEEIKARKADNQSADNVISLTGHGTSIESIDIPFKPAKVTIESKSGITAKISGNRETSLNGRYSGYAVEMIDESGTVTCLIDSDSDWILTIEPFVIVDSIPPLNGNKGMISDAFLLDAPAIIHVKAEENKSDDTGYFSVYLYRHDQYGWSKTGSYSVHEFMLGNDTVDTDLIIEPYKYSEVDMYVLYVQDDIGVEWNITVK